MRRPAPSRLDEWRERWPRWPGDARGGVFVLVAVALVAGFVWYRIGASAPAPPRSRAAATTTRTTTSRSAATPTTGRTDARVVVHVAGAVTRPGVVDLPSGARVIDAVEAAGGGRTEADLDRLNLAAKLVDGQRILVPRVGELGTGTGGASAGSTAGNGTATSTDGATAEDGRINLNLASQAELESLPGIGPQLAGAIIDERARRGSFRSVNELRDVRGIGEKRFADLRDRVTV